MRPAAVPGLALSARPSADSTVWRLRLRPGVRFQDGARFNASAVLANTDRWLSTPAGRRVLGQLLVDAPRPDLVRFILPSPDPHFDRVLASPRLGIVSPEAIAQAGGGRLDPGRFPDSGTGPFELRERSPDRLLLARNTEWWGAERGLGPGVDQLELLAVPNPADRLAMLRDGSARVAALGPSQLEAARRDPLLATVPGPGRGRARHRALGARDPARASSPRPSTPSGSPGSTRAEPLDPGTKPSCGVHAASMTMGTGLFLVAVGAILRYAVNDTWDAVNLETVGLILMIVGVVAFVVGAIYAFSIARRRRDAVVVDRDPRY